MSTYQFEVDLYTLYDRAFEDCIAKVTVAVPDTYKEKCPEDGEVSIVAVSIEKDTADFLVGTYRTDIAKLVNDIINDLTPHIYDTFVEYYGESISEEEWESWNILEPSPPGKPVEIINAEELFG